MDKHNSKAPRLVTVELRSMKVRRSFGVWSVWCVAIMLVIVALNYATTTLRFMTLELKTESFQAGVARLESMRELSRLSQKDLAREDAGVVREIAVGKLGMQPIPETPVVYTERFSQDTAIRYKVTSSMSAPYQALIEDAAERLHISPVRSALLSFIDAGKAFAAATDVVQERREDAKRKEENSETQKQAATSATAQAAVPSEKALVLAGPSVGTGQDFAE